MLRRVGLVGVFLSLLQIATFTAAWPWPPNIDNWGGVLLRRADTASSATSDGTASTTTPPSAQASKTQAPASQTGKSSTITSASAGGSAAATSGGAAQTKASSGATKTKATASETTKAPKSSAVDERLPAGGVNMLTPAMTAAKTYYKVGQNITFGWNYTSLSNEPKAIDVYVTCNANSATYTITSNMTFQSSAKAVWDTLPEQTGANPLLTEQYHLVIHDAAKDFTDIAAAGNLGAYQLLSFPMYTPQVYQNLTDWKCAICSGAMSDMERQTLKFMFGMCAITILSFTWFVGGIGLLR